RPALHRLAASAPHDSTGERDAHPRVVWMRPAGARRARPVTAVPSTYDVLAMGRSCIDLYAHQIGVPITEVTSFDAYVGGCPTNISVGTRRLGLRSAL